MLMVEHVAFLPLHVAAPVGWVGGGRDGGPVGCAGTSVSEFVRGVDGMCVVEGCRRTIWTLRTTRGGRRLCRCDFLREVSTCAHFSHVILKHQIACIIAQGPIHTEESISAAYEELLLSCGRHCCVV